MIRKKSSAKSYSFAIVMHCFMQTQAQLFAFHQDCLFTQRFVGELLQLSEFPKFGYVILTQTWSLNSQNYLLKVWFSSEAEMPVQWPSFLVSSGSVVTYVASQIYKIS